MFQALVPMVGGEGLEIIATIVGLASAVILHEVAHGYVALKLGDPTAYYAGRLTLNPLKHIDMVGTILVPLLLLVTRSPFMFGWAKPVPVNYYNLRYGKYGPLLVALAGPATNLSLVALFGLCARFAPTTTALPYLFVTIALINAVLMLFNLIPIPPLDGSKVLYVFLDDRPEVIRFLEQYSFYIIVVLLVVGGPLLSALVTGPAVAITGFFAGF